MQERTVDVEPLVLVLRVEASAGVGEEREGEEWESILSI